MKSQEVVTTKFRAVVHLWVVTGRSMGQRRELRNAGNVPYFNLSVGYVKCSLSDQFLSNEILFCALFICVPISQFKKLEGENRPR